MRMSQADMTKTDKDDELDLDTRNQMMLEDAIKERSYIISARSDYRFSWDILIIVFAIL